MHSDRRESLIRWFMLRKSPVWCGRSVSCQQEISILENLYECYADQDTGHDPVYVQYGLLGRRDWLPATPSLGADADNARIVGSTPIHHLVAIPMPIWHVTEMVIWLNAVSLLRLSWRVGDYGSVSNLLSPLHVQCMHSKTKRDG